MRDGANVRAAGGSAVSTTAPPNKVNIGQTGSGQKAATNPTTAAVTQPAGTPQAPAFIIPTKRAPLPYIKALFYGEYGAGKTYLCGTSVSVEPMNDVLVISAEGGDLTLWDPEGKHPFEKIDVTKVTDYKTVARVYDFLKVHCSIRDNVDEESVARLKRLQKIVMPDMEDSERIRRYRTVIIDSLTEVEVYCMNQLTGVNNETKMDEEVSPAEWPQYRQQHTMVQRMIRNFRNLPMHVLFTAARGYIQDELKRQLFSPMMTGKLSSQIQGFMDVVGYLVLGQAESDDTAAPRRLYVRPTTRFAAKCRLTPFRGAFFDDPSMEAILTHTGLLRMQATKSVRPVTNVA